jgi:hypothetical protein
MEDAAGFGDDSEELGTPDLKKCDAHDREMLKE